MAKILEPDFRKDLYKNLVDAGYDKTEAQKIIGSKYYSALRQYLLDMIDASIVTYIKEEKYSDLVVDGGKINSTIDELKKLQELLK